MASFNYIADTTQLNRELSNILEIVINNVSNTLLKDFQEHLDATIYDAPPGEKYKRNREDGGFYSGWEIRENQSSALKGYIRTLAFDGEKLVAPSESNGWAHGGNWGGALGGDQRGRMYWILNDITSNDYYSYNRGAKYLADGVSSIGYWDSYLKDIDNKIEKWLNDEFKKYGITRR